MFLFHFRNGKSQCADWKVCKFYLHFCQEAVAQAWLMVQNGLRSSKIMRSGELAEIEFALLSSWKCVLSLLWVDLGWWPCQVLTKLLYCAPQLDGGEKYNERVMGWDKDRGIAHQSPLRANQTQLGEINILDIKSEYRIMRKHQFLEHLPPTPLSIPGSTSLLLISLHPPPEQCRGTGNGVHS